MSPIQHPVEIADVDELRDEGATKTFSLRDGNGYLIEGFIVRFRGAMHAYINRCPHIPLSLDYGDGEVFDENKCWLICRNHGAVFEPNTGKCIAGPCAGASLELLQFEIDGGKILVYPPPPIELE